MNFDSLRTFQAVVDAGSFTRAAERLRTNKAHVSRVVSRLEAQLGVQLLQRSTRRLQITEVGRDLYERAAGILAALEETEAAMARFHSEPRGLLRISAPMEFGILRVEPWMTEYARRYPDVRIEADFSNRVVDVIHEGIDVAIRVGNLEDSELSARRLGEVGYGLYASASYLERKARPRSPRGLAQHDIVMFSPRGAGSWGLVRDRERYEFETTPRFLVNNNLAARRIAEAGLGIALLPNFMAELADTPLERILPRWSRVPVPVHAVFSSTRFMAPKVRSFVDVAVECF